MRVTLHEDVTPPIDAPDLDLLDLDHALTRLAELDPRQARIVELRFFGGLTIDEAADVLDISPRTVDCEWAMARAWLGSQLADDRP